MPDSITPSPELVASLRNSAPHGIRDAGVTRELWLINHAYAAGADQELEACIEWVSIQLNCTYQEHLVPHLHSARRPQPPTLKEQALAAAIRLSKQYPSYEGADIETIRRALEAPDD